MKPRRCCFVCILRGSWAAVGHREGHRNCRAPVALQLADARYQSCRAATGDLTPSVARGWKADSGEGHVSFDPMLSKRVSENLLPTAATRVPSLFGNHRNSHDTGEKAPRKSLHRKFVDSVKENDWCTRKLNLMKEKKSCKHPSIMVPAGKIWFCRQT